MELAIAEAGDEVVRVSVAGRITQRELSPLHDPLGDLLGPTAYHRTVVMDLSRAEYVDSSGIGWLLSCHKRFRGGGGQLVLHSLPPVVSNVVRVLKLDTVFQVAGNQQQALLTAEGKPA
jgi:anti-sigma B factor antagonist